MNDAWIRLGRLLHRLAWPVFWVYLRFSSRTRVLVMADDRILLVSGWLDDGRLGLPGGGLHRGERPAVGAVRELIEETGVVLSADVIRVLGSERWHENGLSFQCHFFAGDIETPTVLTRQRYEIVAVRWVAVAELASVPHKAEVDRALELLGKT